MDELWQKVQGEAVLYSGRVVGVVVLLVVGGLALRYLVVPLRRVLEGSRLGPDLSSFLASTVRALLLVALILAVLQQLGVQTTSLLALLGAAGLAVALSLQALLANFASGLVVLAFRTVRIGDQVQVGDVQGRVSELLPFHVVVETADNQRVTLPNTLLTAGAVRNFSVLSSRRVQWSLPVSARRDLGAVKEALLAVLRADARILADPPAQLFVQEWAEERRVLAVQAWVATANALAVQQELLEQLGQALETVPTGGPDA